MLKDLAKNLSERQLPMTLFLKCNLFVKQDIKFCNNASNRLKKIVKRLDYHEEKGNAAELGKIMRLLFDPNGHLHLFPVKDNDDDQDPDKVNGDADVITVEEEYRVAAAAEAPFKVCNSDDRYTKI